MKNSWRNLQKSSLCAFVLMTISLTTAARADESTFTNTPSADSMPPAWHMALPFGYNQFERGSLGLGTLFAAGQVYGLLGYKLAQDDLAKNRRNLGKARDQNEDKLLSDDDFSVYQSQSDEFEKRSNENARISLGVFAFSYLTSVMESYYARSHGPEAAVTDWHMRPVWQLASHDTSEYGVSLGRLF